MSIEHSGIWYQGFRHPPNRGNIHAGVWNKDLSVVISWYSNTTGGDAQIWLCVDGKPQWKVWEESAEDKS